MSIYEVKQETLEDKSSVSLYQDYTTVHLQEVPKQGYAINFKSIMLFALHDIYPYNLRIILIYVYFNSIE